MTLANHVRTLGRGPGRSRDLTQDEAFDAMSLMLRDDTAPEAVGALLMLLRMKGETAPEIAGLAAAAQAQIPALPQVDLDWPTYAAGRTRGAPWFLLSAKLVAAAGRRVLLHGWNGADPKVRAGLQQAGIAVARSAADAERLLGQDGIAYMPLEVLHPALFRLLGLRGVLGLRSCVNTICRMLNPGVATASVQGVFHPSYRLLQADAGALLGWRNLSVIKGGGGEFERHPSKDIASFGLRDGELWEQRFPAVAEETRRLATPAVAGTEPAQPWDPTGPSAFETEIITGTAALALDTLGARDAATLARNLWASRKMPVLT
ncbi:glycosyl transferase family protein [Jannaschia sp. 2305UL9-9]|uniref:glycosyl transferase family protein n=1 Tax=Jannaschia sp. 2305UL9-9 TaxID=3121638 RepID=UPI00352962D4